MTITEREILAMTVRRVESDVRTLVVQDAATYAQAGELVVHLARLRRRIEAFFAPLEQKAREALEAVRARKQALLGRVVEAERDLDRQMTAWREAQARRAAAEEETIAAALVGTGNPETALAAVGAATPPPKVAGLSYRTVYEPKVVDFAALVQAAAADAGLLAFLAPNLTAIRAAVRQHGMAITIPGVTVRVREIPVKR